MADLVLLEGAPSARGETLGVTQNGLLKSVCDDFRERCQKQGIKTDVLPDFARQLTTVINALVPEWIIEARACAAGGRVPVATYLAASYSPDIEHEVLASRSGEGGTAFIAVGRATKGAKAILHVSRSGRDLPQYVLSRATSPGTLAYLGLGAGSYLGVHAFVNEKGLAGTWQLGPPIQDYGNGLHPHIMLRAVAERSITCRQALEYFSELQGRYGLYTPGNRGVIFCFADAGGESLVIESRSLRHVAGFDREGIAVPANQFQHPDSPGGPKSRDVARQRRLRDHLGVKPVDLASVLAGSRFVGTEDEPGVCSERTRTSFTAFLGGDGCPAWSVVSMGPPTCMQPLVLFPGTGVPAPVLDGSVYASSKALLERFGAKGVPADLRGPFDKKFLDLVEPLAKQNIDGAAREKMIEAAYGLLLDFIDQANAPDGE
ncbi:MAG: C45 family peptidase [Planctomycetes bacterium]|nr:C45 family peptidase [Planctomycetota bacterium]